MRIDKFLKISRVLKRRSIAKELGDNQRLTVNGKVAKPMTEVNVGDIVEIRFGHRKLTLKIREIKNVSKKSDEAMFEIISEEKIDVPQL